jgi:hypothetical protein
VSPLDQVVLIPRIGAGSNGTGAFFELGGRPYRLTDKYDFAAESTSQCPDNSTGAFPNGTLTSDGTLWYGITDGGGENGGNVGTGVIYSWDGSTTPTVLYSFGKELTTFTFPYGGLTYSNGTLYGTTYVGSTVWSFSVSP